MALALGEEIDTVIIGNGPSALILSYILHGNVPYYSGGHSDALLNRKLSDGPNVLNVTPNIYSHIRSSINYSTQALPVNVLLDTLIRPKGDTTAGVQTCLEWRHEPEKVVPHLVLGNAPAPGGQWADNPVVASWDIGTLSYAEQLTLPGYSIGNHWRKIKNEKLPALIRPTRRDIADYLAAYPAAVGIQEAFRTSTTVGNITRTRNGFLVMPQGIRCKHLVLATGIFNINLPPPSFLSRLSTASADDAPLLLIGSGFTAADIIISTPPTRKIIHIFNWDPANRPSPLKACHAAAYPDYAWIYKQMRLAGDRAVSRMIMPKDPNGDKVPEAAAPSIKQRDWKLTYEGYGNARIVASSLDVDFAQSSNYAPGGFNGRRKSSAPDLSRALTVEIGRSSIGDSIRRNVGSFRYAVGRRGTLSYLSLPLFQEVVPEGPFARRGSSVSHDGFPMIPETERPRSSDGSSTNGGPHLSPTARLMPVDDTDLRRSSFHLDPKRASILSVNRPRSSTHESSPSAPGSPTSSRRQSHFALSVADPVLALRRGSAEIDFATEAKPTLKISGHTMRAKIEAGQDESPFHGIGYQDEAAQTQGFEVAPDVFVIGSLTGDSLIRFAFGGCAVVAGKLMRDCGVLEPLPEPAGGRGTTPAMNMPTQSLMPSFNTIPPTPMPIKNENKNAFDENFSFAGRSPPNANTAAPPRSDGVSIQQGRNPSVDGGVAPHMHLSGQDHAAAETKDLYSRSIEAASGEERRGSWLARETQRRASAVAAPSPLSVPVRAKESEKESRSGSLFGKMKDKMAGR